MAAVAKILSLLFLLLLSSPFHTQARNTHLFNNSTQPKGDNQPQFAEGHTPEKEEPVKAHNFQERKLGSDSEDPTTSQKDGSSHNDPFVTVTTPNGEVLQGTEDTNGRSVTVASPNGYQMHDSQRENGGESATYVTPSGYTIHTSNGENGGRSVTISGPTGYDYAFSSSTPTSARSVVYSHNTGPSSNNLHASSSNTP